MDYSKLGLKVGLEIHQQLDTSKLFCNCPSNLQEREPDLTIRRKLHAVAGEFGKVDPAALQAYLRDKTYVYNFYSDSSCLLELDEIPPERVNQEALDITLQVALLLNSQIIDELHFMRKTVIDGSNTSGFQRTGLVAVNGSLDKFGVKIPTICLEEDASRIVETRDKEIVYNLDRLGIPLIELATSPDIKSPEQAREVALAIGSILRATGKVKRGIGTIRQDLNISIKGGNRIEIKGIQELNLIPKYVENEIQRQLSLIKIKDDLKRKKAKIDSKIYDLTKLFKKTESHVLKGAVEKNGVILAIRLQNYSGILQRETQPERTFGRELADYAVAYGTKGLFHLEELPAYGITQEEVNEISKFLKLGKEDIFILIAGQEETCKNAVKAVAGRASFAFEGVPEETRKALPDANSSYMRPLPGASRMYPETDLSPVIIDSKKINELKKNLPELPWEQLKNLEAKYKLSKELANELYSSKYLNLFQSLVNETKVEPSIIASTFTNTVKSLNDQSILQEAHFKELFDYLNQGKFSKEAIPKILEAWIEKPSVQLDNLLGELNLAVLSITEVESIIEKIISKNKKLIEEKKEHAVQPLMGLVMKEVRGKADGKTVMEILRKKVI